MEINIPNNQPKMPEIPTNGINIKTENNPYTIAQWLYGRRSLMNMLPKKAKKMPFTIIKVFQYLFTRILIDRILKIFNLST